jgi:hypothetical protein
MLVQFDLHRVTHLLPRQCQPLLFVFIDTASRSSHQIENIPLAHLLQGGFGWNPAVHHPDAPRFAVRLFDVIQKRP